MWFAVCSVCVVPSSCSLWCVLSSRCSVRAVAPSAPLARQRSAAPHHAPPCGHPFVLRQPLDDREQRGCTRPDRQQQARRCHTEGAPNHTADRASECTRAADSAVDNRRCDIDFTIASRVVSAWPCIGLRSPRNPSRWIAARRTDLLCERASIHSTTQTEAKRDDGHVIGKTLGQGTFGKSVTPHMACAPAPLSLCARLADASIVSSR